MFEELKKQCYDALQDTGQTYDGIKIVLLGKSACSTKEDVLRLYNFLLNMESKKDSDELKKFVKEKSNDIPYIIDFDDTSEVNKFQEWIEKENTKYDKYITEIG